MTRSTARLALPTLLLALGACTTRIDPVTDSDAAGLDAGPIDAAASDGGDPSADSAGLDGGPIDAAASAVDAGAGTTTGCTSTADCSEGVCDYASGACVAETPDVCVTPDDEGGAGEEGDACGVLAGTPHLCGSGLTCVPRTFRYDDASGTYSGNLEVAIGMPLPGICRPSCNPCEDTCASHVCVARGSAGGFCEPSDLLEVGEVCSDSLGVVGECRGGATCLARVAGDTAVHLCVEYCRPDDAAYARSRRFDSSSPSADCGADAVCSILEASISGDVFQCVAGTAGEVGDACNTGDTFCTYPAICANRELVTSTVLSVPGACSPELTTCDGASCPDGTHCRTVELAAVGGVPGYACIGEHALPRNGACSVDLDCASGLTCQTLTGSLRVCR